jgi:spermidine synthase
LLFIPWVGTTRTLCLSSAVLVLNALVLRGAKASSAWSGAIVVGCVCWSALIGVRDVTAAGGRVLWQTESRYQHITVLEKSAERQLRINEGFALQSFVYLDGRLPIRSVWAYYALAPSFIREPMPHRALLLGLGGGTTVQIYRRLFPSMELTGVELDPQMLEAGQSALGVDFGGVRLVTDDARVFVSREAHQRQHSYDVIVLDAFQFPYIPFQLSTREFFRDLDALLASGGVVMLNVGRHGDHHEVVDAVARTLNDVFPHVLCADVVNQSNSILVASRHAFADAMGRRAYGPGALRLVEGASIASGPLHAATWPHGTPVLTDDLAPVESLTDQIVWHTLFDAAMREPGAG